MPKTNIITTLMISMVWIGFIAVVFGLFISNLATNYGVSYNENNTALFNKLETLNELGQNISSETDITEESNALDVIGGYFSSGYKVLKSATSSVDIFADMTYSAANNEHVNIPAANSLYTAIIASLVIIVFIGAIVSAIVKWAL